ncbi:sensor histidine kinase [Streptomyces gobiensis]|uniref:sensor histidine kinase n=1 Tax=Streptomyces gobiensis TaxID=2875706 RepID=UPI001E4B42F6|nr:ATP-binding protein [Streptomyces gobiensis]UGY95034.1 HAMP domain-containing protein [Streptomyces gobiensis]
MFTAVRELLRGRFARRLALAFAALGIGTAALTAVLVNTAFTARFEDYLSEQQHTRQQQLVSLFASDYRRDGTWDTRSLDQLAPTVTMTGSEAELLDASGRKVWSLADANVDAAMSAMHRDMMGTGDLGPPSSLPVTVDGQQVGTLQVRVPQGTVPAVDKDFQSSVNRQLTAGAIAAALVALVVGAYTARRATAPIAELTHAANDLAAGRRDRRATAIPDNEIGQLATAFNTMADRVEKEDQLRRAFAADVAHELRTPLAIQRSQLEAIQDGISKPTQEVITSLHEETLRLARLVADLETLASADAAAFTLERRPLSLTVLVTDAVTGLGDSFAEAGIAVRTDLDEVRVDGDAVRLRQIVTNQLTNALKFVPRGGTVTLTLRREGHWAILRVADTGPGIPADDLRHIFDRFFRGSTARANGSGIGLAVAAELTTAHGGTLTADSIPGHGTTFTTRLPALDGT